MKKILYSTFLLGALMLTSIGCSDFGDINVDPNNTTSVSPSVLLTSALRNIDAITNPSLPEFYVQRMSSTQYSDGSRYADVNFNFNGWYTGPLADLNHIIDLNTNPETSTEALSSGSNANQIAVARIMKAYFFGQMTDRWGPLPYSQALQGRDNFRPSYDSQETIYRDILKELKEAVGQIDGGVGVAGDFIFGGDMDAWKKFANTARANFALRMSEVDPAGAQAEFNDAMGAGVIDADAMYPYLAEAANQNPWFGRFITRTDFAISDVLVDAMAPVGDPRLNIYADPAPNHGEVRGMPYGIENAGDIPNADISFPGFPAVRGQDSPIPIFSLAQVNFMRAEAAQRGWNSDSAEEMYNAGIMASMAQWGVDDADAIAAFMAQDGIAFDGSLEQIMVQKWVAGYLQGYEGWADFRRTGFPALTPAEDPLNGTDIPVRQGYPTSERDLNEENYNAGVGLLGGEDGLGTPLWWDK